MTSMVVVGQNLARKLGEIPHESDAINCCV